MVNLVSIPRDELPPVQRAHDWLKACKPDQFRDHDIYLQVDRLAEQPYLISQVNEMARSGSAAGLHALLDGRILTSKTGHDFIAIDAIDWSNLSVKDRSQLWFLQQWYFVRHCFFEQATQGTFEAVRRIKPVVRSWIENNLTVDALGRRQQLAWHDHVTALRCIHMIGYLKLLAKMNADVRTDFPQLSEFVNVHIRLLLADEFYAKHTNHGFDQTIALYLLCNAFDLGEVTRAGANIARARLIDEASFAFNEEGVHIENSPGYHPMMMNRLLQARNIVLAYEKIPVNFDFVAAFAKALEFLTYALRPDGTLPAFGDTQLQQVRSTFDQSSPVSGDKNFRYAVSRGKDGERPAFNFRVFPNAGYAFMRSRWADAADFTDVVHLGIKCGFLSTYHRHDDDNNIVLYAYGEDWLIEGGLYNHHEDDPYRIYLRSSLAHNIVSIEGVEALRVIPSLGRRCGFTSWETIDNTSTLTARSYMLKSFCYDRTVALNRSNDEISLKDQVTSLNSGPPRNFEQRFHLPADKEVHLLPDRRIEVRSTRTGRVMYIEIREGEFDDIEVVSARDEPTHAGWTSPVVGSLQKAFTVIYTAKQKTEFKSAFAIMFSEGQKK